MMLRVELKPEPADEIELRFEEIDVGRLEREINDFFATLGPAPS